MLNSILIKHARIKFRDRVVTVQGKPKNRKLPYSRLSICKTIHVGSVWQFPIFGYSL